ncbi:energy transducer TonB [Cloacibacterium normanense]|uniref:Gram-negative bacterial tonB family protein n=1 Tax=Cloacibacterium normanense TaxID=237258 RepID=A0A1E5UFK8_9FLAO|nr:energy transducer TonB [Cloacibacterium normanense]AZI68811.1 energy transducer TonB [Cloacibacterium normanense]OEL11686.1 gram-negative bacterial tonB family protein [Cloacibacterium normanense]SDO69748.1 protein TonB [Cloacibacterium normanense]
MSKNFFTYDPHQALNEVVFEKRNKEYGAYALRNEANVFLKKALFIGVGLFGLLAMTLLVIANLKPKAIENPVFVDINIKDLNLPEDVVERPIPRVIPPKAPVQVKTQSLTPPTPTRNAVKEETINQKVDDAVISTTTTPGVAVTNPNQHVATGTENGKEIVKETPAKPNPNEIVKNVDVEADFIGGVNAFRTKVLQNFDSSVVENETGEVVKAVVTFVVERDGTISNIKVSGENTDFNKEAEKTIKGIKGKWNPAKFQGENVRSYFRFPISMQFE